MADDAAREAVENGGAVQFSFRGRVFGDVGDPQNVGRVGVEAAVDQVVLGGRAARGSFAAAAPVDALEAGLSHEPLHPLAVHRLAQPERQLGVHAG
ncbi:hypothetical protein GCM10009550_76400 [Actinocorallia libanotica]|uniref:Uncharacterized protein n=1 Tax=Actinocorallia libanotica TaxID=46162 RepID=A0ABN1S0V8_9ACTN